MKYTTFFLVIFFLIFLVFSFACLRRFLPADHVFNRTSNRAEEFILRSTPVPTGVSEFRTIGTITEIFPASDDKPCSLEVNSVNLLLDGVSSDESTASAEVGKIEGVDCASSDIQELKGRYIEAVLREVKNEDGTKYYSLRGNSKYYIRLMPEYTPGF